MSYPEATEAIALIGEMFLVERDLPDWPSIRDERLRAQAEAAINGAAPLLPHLHREQTRPS